MLRVLITILIFISLSACRATGEAEDQFDREDKDDPSLDLGNIGIFKSRTRKENEELRARLERLENAQRTGNAPVYQPTNTTNIRNKGDLTVPPSVGGGPVVNAPVVNQQPSIAISSQDTANFEEWKRARASSSNDYQEFKEYQEWLEFKKLQKQ